MGRGWGTRAAMIAGVRKMPLPIVEPTSTATALHRPSRRGSRSPQGSTVAGGGGGGADLAMRGENICHRRAFALYPRLKPRLCPVSELTPLQRPGRAASSLALRESTRACRLRPMTRRFARLAWAAAVCTYLLIILGAIVRITGSGLACGHHWPLCNGRLLPPLDLPTWIEYGHRLAALAVTGLVVALAGYAWRWRRQAVPPLPTGRGGQGVGDAAAYVAP